MTTRHYDIVVLGGGVSGLSAAVALQEEKLKGTHSASIALFEAGDRLGGHIQSVRKNGFLIEEGPDCFIAENKDTFDFIERLGLTGELLGTSEENRRSFIASGNKLYSLPPGFYYIAPVKILPFLKTPLVSLAGKLRAGCELFIPPKKNLKDESVSDFCKRRFGRETFENLIQPMVSGVYSGDPENLSAASLLQRFRRLETDYGSVIRGLKARSKKHKEEATASGPRYGLFMTFKEGLGCLIDGMTRNLSKDALNTKKRAVKISKTENGEKWRIIFDDESIVDASHILLALPAHISADLLKEAAPSLSDDLSKIPYESVATIQWGYPRKAIGYPLNGFGFVVQRKAGLSFIGCSFSSQKFLHRASQDQCLIRAFVGGAFGRESFSLSDDLLESRVRSELEGLLSIRGKGTFLGIKRYPYSMPQYRVGHASLIGKIEQKSDDLGGLTFLGSAYCGTGISACIGSSQSKVRSILTDFHKPHRG